MEKIPNPYYFHACVATPNYSVLKSTQNTVTQTECMFNTCCDLIISTQSSCGSCGSSLWSLEAVSLQQESCDFAYQFNAKMSTVHGCARRPNLHWFFFLNVLSFLLSLSFVFSKYLYYFLPFFFCIIFDVPLRSVWISSTFKHMLFCIFLCFRSWTE